MNLFNKLMYLGLTLFAVLSVFFTIPSEDKYRTAADEGTYRFYASSINQVGPHIVAEFGKAYVTHKDVQLKPSPIRIGHLMATALWFKIFPETCTSLAWFSFACYVLFLVTSFYFSKKHFGQDIAWVFTTLLASSPLMMALGRRALSDMHGNLWCGLVVWLLLDFLRDRKKTTYLLLLLTFSLSVLARESSLTLWPFLVTAFVVDKWVYRNTLPISYLAGILLAPALIIGVVYLVAFGGIVHAWNLFATLFALHGQPAAQTSPYALLYCSGPWFRYLIDFTVLSPLTLLLFLGFLGHRLLNRDWDRRTVFFTGYFAIIFTVFATMHFKMVRVLINLDMVIALFSALCLWELFKQKSLIRQRQCILAAVIIIFFANYINFTDLFCVKDIYEAISYDLLQAKKIVP